MGADEEQPSVSQPVQEQASFKPTGKKKLLWILLVSTLIVAVGLTLGFVFLSKGNTSQDSSTVEQDSVPSNNDTSQEEDDPVNDNTPAPSVLWPHEESDIPKDPNLLVGILENGLRYMILPHPWPEGQVSFRLHIDAGSLMEDDDQLGYGCFC
jgi:hypothetical protein